MCFGSKVSPVCHSTILVLDVYFWMMPTVFCFLSSLSTDKTCSLKSPSIVLILMSLTVLGLWVVVPGFSLTLVIPNIALGLLMIPIVSLSLLMIPIVSLILVLVCDILLTINMILVGIILCIVASPCFMLVLEKIVCVVFFVAHYFQFIKFSSLH